MEIVEQRIVSLTPPAQPCWAVIGEFHGTGPNRTLVHRGCHPVLALALVDDTWEYDEGDGRPGEREVIRTTYPVTEHSLNWEADDPRGIPAAPGPERFEWSVHTREGDALNLLERAQRRDAQVLEAERRTSSTP